MGLSTHVLDTATGHPAEGVAVVVERQEGDAWVEVTRATTDDDGRATGLAGPNATAGLHRFTFLVGDWHDRRGTEGFWPVVAVCFPVADPDAHLHVPLLLSPYGYSTYRGT